MAIPATYEAHYRHVCDAVLTNESKYTKEAIDELDVDEQGPPEHCGTILHHPLKSIDCILLLKVANS